ncbi:MAG: RES family NAD+ phosphorylase [Ruminococcus sp.]|nr:RES family NAD+ phosphorylase [Ruminococcus sp.]
MNRGKDNKTILNFEGREKLEKTIYQSWCAFRDELKNGIYKYNEVDKAKQSAFLKAYCELFEEHNGISYLKKHLIYLEDYTIVRGTILKENEKPDYERFIPKKEFIKKGNRFSPAGVEWLYLAIGNLDDAVLCSKRECGVKQGNRFGYCNFKIDKAMGKCKLVDLTIADDCEYDELNKNLEDYFEKVSEEGVAFALENMGSWNSACELYDENKIGDALKKWTLYTYSKLLSNEIFIPLDTKDREIEYAPFQTMAQYYISQGYSGIIYGSTVSDVGRNVVLFDKSMAKPTGNIVIE